jgi:hypothetical protein
MADINSSTMVTLGDVQLSDQDSAKYLRNYEEYKARKIARNS